jgi:hypothetical protein
MKKDTGQANSNSAGRILPIQRLLKPMTKKMKTVIKYTIRNVRLNNKEMNILHMPLSMNQKKKKVLINLILLNVQIKGKLHDKLEMPL